MQSASGVRRVVILGTGTDVGKTFVASALTRALIAKGDTVAALKPIETGRPTSHGNPPPGSDAEQLEAASGRLLIRPHPLHVYPDPISPHLAAERAGSAIDLAALGRWLSSAEGKLRDATLQYTTCRYLLIETAGGALSPLGPGTSNLDLALALEPALWLLVAPDNLGVLHELRATLVALRSLARVPDLVVLSGARPPDASTGTNGSELARLGIARPAAVLGRNDSDGARALAEAIHGCDA